MTFYFFILKFIHIFVLSKIVNPPIAILLTKTNLKYHKNHND